MTTKRKRNAGGQWTWIRWAAVLGIPGLATLPGNADEAALGEMGSTRVVGLDPFTVFGGKSAGFEIPGSADYIDMESVETFSYDNIEQALRRVPGVYFRTEDGFGLFPNISLRGVGSMRSSSVTIMEDGILSAPAPYAAPSAYYTPTSGRMSGLEIIKGSSQVRYGPQITGGALNYLSTAIPASSEGYLKILYGSEDEFRGHFWHGDTVAAGDGGRFGYLVEGYYRVTDGFKTVDGTAATAPNGNTGFSNFEPMVKFFWEPAKGPEQRFEVKFGYTDKEADETYLGLTTGDFRDDPYRRYAASRFDIIDTEHYRTYLRHRLVLNEDAVLSTTAYFNDFSRAWYKLSDVRAGAGNTNLSQALAMPESDELAVLRGEASGSFRVRNNARTYESYGVHSIYQQGLQIGETTHDLEISLRWHRDYEDRFQNQDTYTQDGTGAITGISYGAPGSQDNRRGTAEALAFSLSDSIQTGGWTFLPGIRYESIDFKNEDRRPGKPSGRDSLDVWAYGLAVMRQTSPEGSVFANAYRGFATPGPSAVVNGGIEEETSRSFELGYRYQLSSGSLRTEVVLFHTDFDDLIVPDNVGGAGLGTGVTENVGEARTRGMELTLAGDLAVLPEWNLRLPGYLAFTYTDAELRNDVSAGGGGGGSVESIFAGGRKGADLPYIPEYQLGLGTGIESDKWGIYLDAYYVPSTYGTASNVDNETRPDGTPDARFGKNDAYFLLDLSVAYHFSDQGKVIVGANNVLDREYIASRLPHGARPGQPRFLYAGLEYRY